MFKEILKILRREDLLKQAMEEAQEMLSRSELMFRSATYRVMECREPDIDIYETDREINRMEWEVRRKVLEHLTLGNNKEDVTATLILTSAVVDIERIGDYSKNIAELADICRGGQVIEADHADFFRETEAQILRIFALTRDSYTEADTKKAQTGMDMHWEISQRADAMVEHLAAEYDLGSERAVVYALLSRYLKRVSSHLKNIASSVVNPFPRMGFKAGDAANDLDVG